LGTRPDRARLADRRAGRSRARRPGGRSRGPHAAAARPRPDAGRRAGAPGHGLVGLPWHEQEREARRVHHRAGPVPADPRRGRDAVNGKLFGETFVTLFVIMDPPGSVPIFLALTGAMAARDRQRAAWQAVALAGGVTVVFAVA